jgi:hypothetical protein
LPDRPEYVVDTSEFESVKARLSMLENARRLGGAKPEPGRPVLLKRTSSSSTADDTSDKTNQASTGSPDPQDNGRPTLKKAPGSTSGNGDNATPATNGGSTDSTQAQTSNTPAGPNDDDRPVLKRNPSSTSD